jgi:hypothetical protein
MKQLSFLFLLFLSVTLSFQPVQAQEETETNGRENVPQYRLDVASGDNPLVIRGQLDSNTTVFSGNVRLTAVSAVGPTQVGNESVELRFLPGDLNHTTNNSFSLNRANVTVPAGTILGVGQPRDIQVTISNVTRPGEYTGELRFLLPGQLLEDAATINLHLIVTAKPVVSAADTALTLQLVRCREGWDCRLASWFLHEGVLKDRWQVQLDNATLSEVQMTTAVVVLRGERTGSSVSPADVHVELPLTLPASQVAPATLVVKRNQLAPDRYQGTIRFKAQGLDEAIPVVLDITVRAGPWWPFWIIVLGIALGRLARGMETPAAKLQMKYARQLTRIRLKAQAVSNAGARSYLSRELGKVNEAINRVQGVEDEASLKQTLEQLEKIANLLLDLDKWEAELARMGANNTLSLKLKPMIIQARNHVVAGETESAVEQYNLILSEVRAAQANKQMGDPQTDQLGVTEAERTLAELTTTTEKQAAQAGRRLGWLYELYKATARFVAGLLGMQLTADVRYWLLRPIFWLLVLFLLALLGMQTLYVNAGATFGAAGIYDYLGLFLWGVSVDVASSGLRNLQSRFSGNDEEGA